MKRGDIYLVTLDRTERREQPAYRPVPVVSPAAFNQATTPPIVPPIPNGGDFARRIGFAVLISGISTTGSVRCDQPRGRDLQAWTGRKLDTVPAALLEEVLARVGSGSVLRLRLTRLNIFL